MRRLMITYVAYRCASGSANLLIVQIPYARTASRIPNSGATIVLAIPLNFVPKKTNPTLGLILNGLEKLESAISAKAMANTVSSAPRFFCMAISLVELRGALDGRSQSAHD